MVNVAEEWVKVFACATAPPNGARRMSIITAPPSNPGRNTVRNICTLLIHLCNPFNTSKSTQVVNVLVKHRGERPPSFPLHLNHQTLFHNGMDLHLAIKRSALAIRCKPPL